MKIGNYTHNLSVNRGILINLFLIIITCYFIINYPSISIFFLAGLIIVLLVYQDPLYALSIFILIVPFSNTNIFYIRLLKVPGSEPIFILSYLLILVAMINYKKSIKMPKFSLIFTFIILTVFAFSIVYSLNNLENINFRRIIEEKSEFSIFSYILQSFVRPLFYFLPFIIIVKYLKNADRIKKLTNIIALSLTILSISLLYVYIFKIGIMGDIRKATEIYSITFGLHRNDIADYFILGFPYLLAGFFIKKNILNIFVICLSILATGFLFSRTAYVIIFFSIIFYLIISKRAKLLPILIAFILILSFLISSSIILERASKGISSGDRNEITAGRIDNIWLPLIDEYIHNPKKLFLGNGRYAIISSDAVAYGLTQDTMWHPHNMYLEQIIDSGILCFFLVIFLYIKFFTKILKTLKIINNYVLKEYLYASIISLISYFISGLTGRSLFPTLKNSFFWISMGITVAIINIFENYKQKVSVEN